MSTTERSYMQDFSKFSVLFKLYLVKNQSKNLPLLMNLKKYFVFMRLLIIKNNSHADMRTSHAQLLTKAFSMERKSPKVKLSHKMTTLLVKKSR